MASGVGLITSDDEEKKANEDALHWLIALQEDPDDPDVLARLDAWLASGPRNERAWAQAQHVWRVIGDVRPAAVPSSSDTARRTGRPRDRRRPGWHWRPRHLAAFAAGAVAACLVAFFAPAVETWLHADYATDIAQTRTIRLDDGSLATLGADSAIDIAFEPGLRRVRLLSGEAYFEVEPDPSRPFQVAAGPVDATVLGTAFDVRMMSGGVSVAVNHGRVGVAAPDAGQGLDTPLEAGDWVRIDRNGKVERGNDAPDLVGGWRTGMLVVKDRSVADVVDEIGRHYRGSILLPDGDLGTKRVTGVYDLGRPVDALQAVAQAHGGHVWSVSPWITIVSGR